MASEGLECSICCERFDDKKLCPCLLSCGHSFCSGCLEKLLRDQAIICPTCRSTVGVPAGIEGLPKNFALLDIILATPQHVGDESLHVCEACDDKQHSATSCCLDCKEDMCKDAAHWHTRNKATRDHRVVSLAELKANPKLAAESVFCPEHNEQFRFFDEECNTVICRDCATLKHNGHKCLSLAEAASKYQQEMQALANKAITHAEEIKAAEARVLGVSLDLKKAHEKQAAQIEHTFKELHEALTVREQVLMNELDELHKTKEFTLTEQQDHLRIFQACLQSTAQRVLSTVQSASHTELLVARSDTVETLRALERQPLVLEPQADCVLEFTVDRQQMLDVLNSVGIVSDKSTCAATTTAEGSAGVKHVQVCKEASPQDVQKCQRGGDLSVVELKEELGVSKTELKRTEKRWVKPRKVSNAENEEENKTEALYCNVRRILNKVTPPTFQTFTQQIIDLDIDTPERLEGTVDLIFEKAINEELSSLLYANMCRCLIPKRIVVEKDGIKKDVTFRKILLNRCQKEFEKEKSIEKRIHEKLEALTKEGLSEEDLENMKKELQDEEHQSKRRTLGNIRFLGELFKLKMLTESIMHDCVVKLLKSNDEESFECLCKLLVTIGKDLDHMKAKPRVDQYFAQINKIIQARITSSRVRSMMVDIVDLRNNDWAPRREDNNPKTIDQIHKEAADRAKKTQMKLQMDKQQENKMHRGNMGGRYSPRQGSIPQADETWTTVGRGPRNVSVDPKKFQNIKRPVDSKIISLGPGGKGYGAWARGSTGGTGAVGAGAGLSASAVAAAATAAESDNRPSNRYSALAGERKLSAPTKMSSGDSRRQEVRSLMSGGGRRGPFPAQGEREKALEAVRAAMQPKRNTQERDGGRESPRQTPEAASPTEVPVAASSSAAAVQELTKEAMKKKSISIIDKYLNIRDINEATECLRELQSPSLHYVFVDVVFNHTMEKKVSDRHATGKLLHSLLRNGVLTAQQYLQGLDQILEYAEDIEIDIPQLWNYLGQLMAPTAFDGNLNLDELFNKCVLKYVSKNKAAKLFAYMLQTATNDTSREDVSASLSRYDVTLNTFFENEEEAKQFAKDKNIEFALPQDNSSSQITGSASQHSAIIQELRTLILKRKARNEEVFGWINKNVSAAATKESSFIRALVTVVCEGTMDTEDGGSCKCNFVKLKDRKHLLQKYIDDNTGLELQALYAVQALFVQLDHPPGFIKSYFDSFYDEEIITEESFHAWESSSNEEPGKGVAVTAASEFFRWLKSAPGETGEDS